MEATGKNILVYRTAAGRSPFEEWLGALKDRQVVAQIQKRLIRIELGNFGDVKPVGRGISEMRIHVGPGYRIYFAQEGNQIIILLCGGDKGSQAKDIKLAQEYWADLEKRRNENG
ncbi:MAG: addiction module killer protein [Bdellovibrio sp.]|nr:MAG: addiction module killer protein [Bdellovibrio sp.]